MDQQKMTYISVATFLNAGDLQGTLLVVSPTSYQKLDEPARRVILRDSTRCFMTDVVSPENLDECLPSLQTWCNKVVAIGGGTAIDYGKYLAAHIPGCYCSVVPSMLSTNAFATNKVALIRDNVKRTENGVLPDEVVLDWAYIEKSPQQSLYGLVDVYSIFTALMDWDLAHQYFNVDIDQDIYTRAQDLLLRAIELGSSGDFTLEDVFKVVQQSGYITNDYGSGRPESGSEHIFASALESQCPLPHALAVALGMHVMVYYYSHPKRMSAVSASTFCSIPFVSMGIIAAINKLELPWSLVSSVVTHLTPRADKPTIVDLLQVPDSHELAAMRTWLRLMGLKFVDAPIG